MTISLIKIVHNGGEEELRLSKSVHVAPKTYSVKVSNFRKSVHV